MDECICLPNLWISWINFSCEIPDYIFVFGFCLCVWLFILLFLNWVLVHSPGLPWISREVIASASWALGLKICASILVVCFLFNSEKLLMYWGCQSVINYQNVTVLFAFRLFSFFFSLKYFHGLFKSFFYWCFAVIPGSWMIIIYHFWFHCIIYFMYIYIYNIPHFQVSN